MAVKAINRAIIYPGYQTVILKELHFIACELHLNKVDFCKCLRQVVKQSHGKMARCVAEGASGADLAGGRA